MGSQQLHIPSADDVSHASTLLGGMSFTWGDEGALAAESSGKYLDIALNAGKLSGYSIASNELVADSAFETWIRRAWPLAAGWAEDDKFVNGSGAGEPLGVVNSPCAIGVTRTTTSKVLFADIPAMLTRLLPQSFPRCVWLCGTDVLAQLLGDFLQVGTTPTAAVTAPTGWLQGDEVSGWRLLNRPLYVTEHSPALGSTGDVIRRST